MSNKMQKTIVLLWFGLFCSMMALGSNVTNDIPCLEGSRLRSSSTTVGVGEGFKADGSELKFLNSTVLISLSVQVLAVNWLKELNITLDDTLIHRRTWPAVTVNESIVSFLWSPAVGDGNHRLRAIVTDWNGVVNDSYTQVFHMQTALNIFSRDFEEYLGERQELEGEAWLNGTIYGYGVPMEYWNLTVGPIVESGVIPPDQNETFHFSHDLSSLANGTYMYNLTINNSWGLGRSFVHAINITYNPTLHVPVHSNLLPVYTFKSNDPNAALDGTSTDPDGNLKEIKLWINGILTYDVNFTAGIASHDFLVPLDHLEPGTYNFNLTTWDHEGLETSTTGVVEIEHPGNPYIMPVVILGSIVAIAGIAAVVRFLRKKRK